jgi:HSP20 family protein
MAVIRTLPLVHPFESVFLDAMRCGQTAARERPCANPAITPSYTITRSSEADTIHVELPGVQKESLKLDAENFFLFVSGSRGSRQATALTPSEKSDRDVNGEHLSYSEKSKDVVRYEVKFRIPERSDADEVKADYADGLLTIRVPHRREAERRHINVSF